MSAKSKLLGEVLNLYLSSRPAKHALYEAGRRLRGGRRRARLYYRADDPYSHLLAQVAPRLTDTYAMQIDVIPVAQPGPGAHPAPDLLLDHAIRDAVLLAERYGLSFPRDAKPPPEDRVRRAHAVLLEPRSAQERSKIAVRVGEAVWGGDGAALGAIVETHGAVSGEAVRPALEANYAALERAGHYQPGMLHYGGDWYWGIDRLGFLEERLRREGEQGSLGLEPRPVPTLASAITMTGGTKPELDAFVSFRSPYSYIAVPQLIALRDRYGIDVRLRPVLPMVMRGLPVPKAKRLYIALDAKREADRLGIPFGRVCDPLGEGIKHCMAVFFKQAVPRGLELEMARSVMEGIWSEALDVGHLPDLVTLCGRVGIDEAEVRSAIEDRSWKDEAAKNREALAELGLWGVPSFRIGAYSTWGQDRIPLVEAEIARLFG